VKVGNLPFWSRLMFFVSGMMFAFPEMLTTLAGAGLTIGVFFILWVLKRYGLLKQAGYSG
ncbi:MAG: hypothetical protein N3E40_05005, partial [Dehalococcoidia bacterium]|nr:hypothetical protein [Dehalococcoidia bacterium]